MTGVKLIDPCMHETGMCQQGQNVDVTIPFHPAQSDVFLDGEHGILHLRDKHTGMTMDETMVHHATNNIPVKCLYCESRMRVVLSMDIELEAEERLRAEQNSKTQETMPWEVYV